MLLQLWLKAQRLPFGTVIKLSWLPCSTGWSLVTRQEPSKGDWWKKILENSLVCFKDRWDPVLFCKEALRGQHRWEPRTSRASLVTCGLRCSEEEHTLTAHAQLTAKVMAESAGSSLAWATCEICRILHRILQVHSTKSLVRKFWPQKVPNLLAKVALQATL